MKYSGILRTSWYLKSSDKREKSSLELQEEENAGYTLFRSSNQHPVLACFCFPPNFLFKSLQRHLADYEVAVIIPTLYVLGFPVKAYNQ